MQQQILAGLENWMKKAKLLMEPFVYQSTSYLVYDTYMCSPQWNVEIAALTYCMFTCLPQYTGNIDPERFKFG